MGFLEDWDLSYDEINELLTDNPSLRSFLMGYAAEVKCRDMHFRDHPDVTAIYKPDDHNRTEKGDLIITYKGHRFAVEVKSVQAVSMKPKRRGQVLPWYQCDASDRRTVHFADGTSVETTALLVGEFDVVAVNIHSFAGKWDFAFVKNEDLPTMEGATRGAARNFTPFQQKNLIKTAVSIPLSVPEPYVKDPFVLFDQIIEERQKGEAPVQKAIIVAEDTDGDADGSTLVT